MSITNYVESWKDIYEKYKTVVNFVAGDYESLKNVIRYYITVQNPENYNDWAESSEVGMFANGLAYLGETLHYRVDLNAHDVFPSTTERKQSLLNFTKMLSYSPSRNICSNGIAKLVSVSTTQKITDMMGKSLKDATVYWNDSTDEDWLEHFLLIMNSAFSSNNPYGKPLKKENVDGVSTQLYQLNNVSNVNCSYSFTSIINGNSQNFEVVNPDIDTTLKVINERNPIPEQAFHILYRNDGTGNSSKNTGFFVFWKQGNLNYEYVNFDKKIENNSYEIDATNVNEYDVWVQEIDSVTGLLKNNWTKIDNDEYLDYNNTDNDIRNIFKVETRDNDSIIIRFSDGNFGTIPYGLFRFWYRVSQGNMNLYIKPSDIQNISIQIPYKSSNTTDDNVYYLTLTFTVQDIMHIRQSVPQEDVEDIRTRAPQVYSTQNRMVTGKDYNLFPKSYGSVVKKCKSILRTYAGNSRYVQFNDGTGTYQDLNILAEDGYLYKDETVETNEIPVSFDTKSSVILNEYILPLLNSKGLDNYYYDNFETNKVSTTLKWREKYSQGNNLSYGELLDDDNNVVSYLDVKQYLKNGNLVRFFNSKTEEEKWVTIISIEYDDVSYSDYTIGINEILNEEYNEYNWNMTEYFNPLVTSFSSSIYNEVIEYLDNKSSFGLNYNDDSSEWYIVKTEDMTDDNWILKAEFKSPDMYSFTIKNLKYIFGSENKATFFFNTDEKISNEEFYTKDYIKILSINGFTKDYYWKPYETIKYIDGFTDNRKVVVYGYNNDKDETIDNPLEFENITNNNLHNLYFINGEYNSSVKEIDSWWENTNDSGLFYCKNSGTIYPAGSKLPHNVTIKKTVKLSNGRTIVATNENPHIWLKGSINDYDIVDDGLKVEYTWQSEIDPSVQEDYLVKYSVEEIGGELANWDARNDVMVRYDSSIWETKLGIGNLSFIWQHYASSNHLIDPCSTNIIDMYVLTNDYYSSVYNWVQNGKSEAFPKAPTATELRSTFSNLEDYSMLSDSLVYHPIKYKVLFGNYSDNEYRASFRVIKSKSTTLSDNEIKKQVIDYIDEYFKNMDSGQTFYFIKLSSYIDSKMNGNISSIVIVPMYSNNKFGNLFEINCEEDDILISSATIDDVQIITNITQSNIKIGN